MLDLETKMCYSLACLRAVKGVGDPGKAGEERRDPEQREGCMRETGREVRECSLSCTRAGVYAHEQSTIGRGRYENRGDVRSRY